MNRSDQGLTLVELLVAMVFFGLIISAVLSALPSLFQANRKSGDQQAVGAYAKVVIERTRNWWLTEDTAAATDRYPNFTAGSFPASQVTPAASLSCEGPKTNVISTAGTPAIVSRRLLSVTCKPDGKKAITVIAQIGRPK